MKRFKQFVEDLVPQSGTQYGSNPGGIHEDPKSGEKFYVKEYGHKERANVEALTGKIYDHMGIKTLGAEVHNGTGIKSKWNPDVSTKKSSFYDHPSEKHAHQLGKMYHAAILTKNWDIAGLVHDNIVHDKKTDDLVSIDHGGSFHYRAQGAHKGYGPDIGEKESLRNPSNASGHVFNTAFKHYPEAEHTGLKAVKDMDMDHVHHLFKTSGLDDWKEHYANFVKRRENLIKSYEKE